jgi:fibronectin type 3 domain-containing protein
MMDMTFFNRTKSHISPLFRTLLQKLGFGLAVVGLVIGGIGCDSGGSSSDTTPPPAPSGLEVSSGDQEVTVEWSSVDAEDLAGYAVRRTTDGSDAVSTLTPQDTLFTETSFTDSGVRNGTVYTYWVVAIDDAGNESDRSSEKEIRPFDGPPGNP